MKPIGPMQQALLDILAPGRWVHGAKLVTATGKNRNLIWHAIERLRYRGFVIEGHWAGQASRGYRLVHDPRGVA